MLNEYSKQGVSANQVVIDNVNTLSITYNGLLYNSGADAVYAHFGYGDNWSDKDTIKMIKTDGGFRASIPVTKTGVLNIAFKDSANNWDNNNGANYSFHVRTK